MQNFDLAALQESARRHNARIAAQQQPRADAPSPASAVQPNRELTPLTTHSHTPPSPSPSFEADGIPPVARLLELYHDGVSLSAPWLFKLKAGVDAWPRAA